MNEQTKQIPKQNCKLRIDVAYSSIDALIAELQAAKRTLKGFVESPGECSITIDNEYYDYDPTPTTVVNINYSRPKNEKELADYNAEQEQMRNYRLANFNALKKEFGG